MHVAIFVSVAISVSIMAFAGLCAVTTRWHPGRAHLRRRLTGEFGSGAATSPGPLYRDLARLNAEVAAGADATYAQAARLLQAVRWRAWIEEQLRQARVPGTAGQWLWLCLGATTMAACAGALLAGWLTATAAGLAGVSAPVAAVVVRRNLWRERYQAQLVGAFELMARVLRSGQAVPEAFRAVVDAYDDPLAEEFGRCLHQIEHGLRPETAFRELSDRSAILELRIFVVAMAIQRQTGGNLVEVLERLAGLVRARLRGRQKVRALTAEGRLQSLTLVVLPPLTFGMMYLLNRPYAEALLTHRQLLAATAACMAVGVVWIRNITNLEG